LFKKKRMKYDTVPQWAKFFSLEEFNSFIEQVESYFGDAKQELNVEEGTISAIGKKWPKGKMGLHNISRFCKENEPKNWKILIQNHFDRMAELTKEDETLKKIVNDFDKVSKHLALRIYPVEVVHKSFTTAIYREDIPGLATVLMFDLPNTVKNVDKELTKKWKKTDAELFEIGMKNVMKNNKFQTQKSKVQDMTVSVICAENSYSNIAALDPAMMKKCTGPMGAIVSLPHRDAAFVYPIESADVLKDLMNITKIATSMFTSEVGPVTDKIYWYYNKKYTLIPYGFKDKTLTLEMPPGLQKVIEDSLEPGSKNKKEPKNIHKGK
jgi:hypothetical protein